MYLCECYGYYAKRTHCLSVCAGHIVAIHNAPSPPGTSIIAGYEWYYLGKYYGTTYIYYSGSLNQCVLLFYTSNKRETFCVRSHTVKSIWKCRPTVGRHFDVGFINQALLAKVSLLDNSPFCGTVKPQPRPENPTDKMKQMSIMANPIMSGDSLVFLTTAHNRAMSSTVQNRLSTDTYVTQRPNLLRENGYVV